MMHPRKVNFAGLFPHQQHALQSAQTNNFQETNPIIISMPTGTGKTMVVALLPYILESNRVLIIAPDLEIFMQLETQFMGTKKNPDSLVFLKHKLVPPGDKNIPAVQAISSTAELDVPNLRGRDIVIANVDKFHTKKGSSDWQECLPKDLFDLVIVDEAHHLPSDKWRIVVEHFQTAKLVFMTATPYRANGESILSSFPRLCTGKLVFRYSLAQAIEEYVLSQVRIFSLFNFFLGKTLRLLPSILCRLLILLIRRHYESCPR